MLRWTPSGAVTLPDTVQIRVEVAYPDRLPAGAPRPSRRLEPGELLDNIRYFTFGLDTPRTRSCTSLVLSGHGVATRDDVPEAVRVARESGMRWVVLHASPSELDHLHIPWMHGQVDRLVLPVQSADVRPRLRELVQSCHSHAVTVAFAVDLRAELLPHLPELAADLDALRPASIAFTWPFPVDGRPASRAPGPQAWEAPLTQALAAVSHTPVLVRGLPVCYLPGHASVFRRTSNRWYVDASHQKDAALLFLPDVLRFDKLDACRFCTRDATCDGFFLEYLDGGHRRLQPVSG
jgi:hypothetical protein